MKRLEVLLHDTEYDGAVFVAEWVTHSTGCFFLDANDEDGYENPPWTLASAAEGKREWRLLQAILDRIMRTSNWLSQDINGRFAELLDFIARRDRELPQEQEPTRPRVFVDIFGPENENG